jgi:hypothetical protein
MGELLQGNGLRRNCDQTPKNCLHSDQFCQKNVDESISFRAG